MSEPNTTPPVVPIAPGAYLTFARWAVGMGVCVVIAGVFFITALLLGSEVPWSRALAFWDWSDVERDIILKYRLPRAIVTGAIGMALGAAGAGVQGVLRNPLAEPYLLGMSGGGALVVAFGTLMGWENTIFLTSLAFAGAISAGAVVLFISSGIRRAGPTGVILAGIMVNAFAGALVQFMYSRATIYEANRIMRWLIGSIPDNVTYAAGVWTLAAAIAGTIVLSYLARPMNLLALGETTAAASGVEVGRLRVLALSVAGFLAATTVAVAGPIGFVGLVVPHAVRLSGSGDNRWVVPGAAFVGAAFLLAADTFCRRFVAVNPLPVGVVTGLVGTPVFLILVVRRLRRG